MRGKITKATVEKLKPGQSLADREVRGFIARRLPSGLVSFGYRYRARGKQRWRSIGVYPHELTVDGARKAATILAGQVTAGSDPVAEAKQAAEDEDGELVRNVAGKYLTLHVAKLKPKTVLFIEAAFRRFILPEFGERAVGAIKRSDVVALLDRIKGETMPDRVLSTLRAFFTWHAARVDNFNSPIVKGMRRRPKRARDRILGDDELKDLWAVLDQPVTDPRASKRFAAFLRAILLTGQRPGEVASMRVDEIGIYRGTPVWTIPKEKYKTGLDHMVPLTPMVYALIERDTLKGKNETAFRKQQLGSRDYIFSKDGTTPVSPNDAAMQRLRKRVNELRKRAGRKAMAHWTRHDLRRTARSLMSRGGVIERDHAERVIGHVIRGVAGVYDRHQYFDEKKQALVKLADTIMSIVAPTPAKVVALRGKRR